MRLFALLTALAFPASAQSASTEPYSIARAGLTGDEVGSVLEFGRGRYIAVGDRLVDVSSSAAAGEDVALTRPEGEELIREVVGSRVARLRAAAKEGRLTEEDRAEARALAVARSTAFEGRDFYFLASLNPAVDFDTFKPGAEAPPVAAPVSSDGGALESRLRSKLILQDHGDPMQAEALDMAVRRMLESSSARKLAAEFVALNHPVAVSFETLEGGIVYGEPKHRHVAGIGGLTSHENGDHVLINAGYLETDLRTQFESIPGTLAHELLGHAFIAVRAANASVTPALNIWQGDEALAAMTGWVVQAELTGRAPTDPYLWEYLEDPARYHRGLQLIAKYYAGTFTAAEAAAPETAYAERLARADKRIASLRARYQAGADWTAVIGHFEGAHGIAPERLSGLSVDAVYSSSAAAGVELARLLEIRAALDQNLKDLKDPVKRAGHAEAAKQLADPFFADADRRLADLAARMREIAARGKPFQSFPQPADAISWDELIQMEKDDRRDHPEHWTATVPITEPAHPLKP